MTCTKKGKFLCKIKETFTKIAKWFTTIFLVGFAWEVVEELLEDCIAYLITSMVARFVVKAISTAGVFGITQGAKTLIKKMIFPFIKTLTYKEGNDKMNIVKKYLTMIWGNKFTGLFAGVGFGLVSYYQTAVAFATGCWWIALIVGLVFFHIAVFVGGETFKQIIARITETTKNKELKAQLKKVQHAQAIVDQYEEAKKIVASAPKQN
jgi:hypothetical protein